MGSSYERQSSVARPSGRPWMRDTCNSHGSGTEGFLRVKWLPVLICGRGGRERHSQDGDQEAEQLTTPLVGHSA